MTDSNSTSLPDSRRYRPLMPSASAAGGGEYGDAVTPIESLLQPLSYLSPRPSTAGSRPSTADNHSAHYDNEVDNQFELAMMPAKESPMHDEEAEEASAKPERRRRPSPAVPDVEYERSGSDGRHQHQHQHQHQQLEEFDSLDDSSCSFCEILLLIVSVACLVLTFPLSMLTCVKIVKEYERAVIFRLGRIQGGPKGPGLFFVVPCIDDILVVGLRTLTFDVPPQEILTKDSVTVSVDAVVYYRIFDPIRSFVCIADAHRATQLLAQTTLRNILGTRTLHGVLAEREAIAAAMQESLDEATDDWGVSVERVEIKDVSLPVQLQRAMAAEAEAQRDARAKVIVAEGERAASRALKAASDTMKASPTASHLRLLQSLGGVADSKNSTVVFPLPLELLRRLQRRRRR